VLGNRLLVQGHQQVHPFPGGHQGLVRHPNPVEEVSAPDAGLIIHDEQHVEPLAHQGFGQGHGNGVHPLPCRPADQDIQINGHISAFPGQTRLIVNNYSSRRPLSMK
jgi:hypothetical protein